MSPRLGYLLLACLLAGGIGGCRRDPGRVASAGREGPIFLISIDTLRSDRLPAYGYVGVSTPALDRLVRDGIAAEHAFSHVPLTLPSHGTMLSGALPAAIGVRDNLGYRLRPERHFWLPDALREAGYATGAAVAAFVLRKETGISSGFDFFDSTIELRAGTSLGSSQRDCRRTWDAARGWLETVSGRPFFLFLHFYEPHTPYAPPEPFASRYRDRPYDGEIAAADACVGELLAWLDRKGLYAKATILIVSDHGEMLGEHGEQEHGILLHRASLQVPWILKLPRGQRSGTRLREPAGLIDVAPTLLDLAGLPRAESITGRSILARTREEKPRGLFAESFYPRLHLGWSEQFSLIRFPHHLIEGPDPELYDLQQDPREERSRLEAMRREFVSMREELKPFKAPLNPPAAEDAETRSQLAALGYLGGGLAAPEGPLPNPKSRIASLADFSRAVRAVSEQDYPLAADLCRKLVSENPYMIDAWENLGIALQRLGRPEDALAAYRKALELSQGSPHLALGAGYVLLELGRFAEALEHAELAQATSPVAALTLRASVARARKDLETAEREARAALELRGARVGPLVVLGEILRDRGRQDEALAVAEEALVELDRAGTGARHPGAYLLRADLLARQGDLARAVQDFEREIELFPGDPQAYTRLAGLLAAAGRIDAAHQVLARLVSRNEQSPRAWQEAVQALRVLGSLPVAERVANEARKRFPGEGRRFQ